MKKHHLRIVLLGAALVAGAFPAFTRAADDTPAKPAQTEPPARPRFNPADMLKNYRDQFEGLNLTDDQMTKIDGFVTTAEAEVKKAGASEDRDVRRGAFEAMNKLRADVNSVLTDTQKALLTKKRNVQSVTRFKEPYVNPALKLTDDQTAKLAAISTDLQSQLDALPPIAPGTQDRDAFRKRGEIFRAAREKANALLTPDQQKLIPARTGRGNRPGGNPPPATGN
jgi:Spy/CpxP family protein refolding chaperone